LEKPVRARWVSLFFSSSLALTGAAAALISPIPRAYGALIAAAVLTGLLWDLRQTHPLPRRLLTVLGAAGFLFTILPIRRETLAEQSLAALSILLCVKLLERKNRRDHLQVLALSAVVTVGAGSLSPDLAFATLIFTICLLGTFYLLWLPFSERPDTAARPGLFRRLSVIASSLILLAVPLALLLFVVLPRSVNPFWGGLAPGRQKVSGFSDEIQLGEVGRLALSRDVAFRAEMVSPRGPLPTLPYWRGIVMEETDGLRWSAVPGAVSVRFVSDSSALSVLYYVEPHGGHQLFLLEQPAAAFLGMRPRPLSQERTLRLRAPLFKRIRYQGLSFPGSERLGKLSDPERHQNLRLPARLSPRIVELALRLTEGTKDPAEKANLLLASFDSGFSYSLDIPKAEGDPLESFIFRTRTGYCEYFASALAVMLRAAGIPARLVAGYLGGEYNAGADYYLVTQSEAHTWVEAWLPGKGWTRFDPTPAAGEFGGTFASRNSPRTRLWLDTLRMKWNSWVVQYDAEVQIGLVRGGARTLFRARLPRFPVKNYGRWGPWLLVLLLLPAAWMVRRSRGGDSLDLRYRRFNGLMSRRGVERLSHEGPIDFSRRAGLVWPEGATVAKAFAGHYARLRYGGIPADASDLKALDEYLRKLR
jgi:transglutaminase-like putative cysteine protease